MQCNFRITQLVEFDGPFGNLDVHNAYDLVACDVGSEGSSLQLGFVANEFVLRGKPDRFQVTFTDATLIELTGLPENLPEFHVDEVGFKSAEDRNYQWSLNDGEPGPTKHFVITGDSMGEAGLIRVCAATAWLEVLP